jgi:hypothetical protein
MGSCTLEQARAAKAKALAVFERLAPVVGVGITRIGDGYGLKVNLRERPADAELPDAVEGVPVRVEVVGQIRPR